MKLVFDKSFSKSLDKISDKRILKHLSSILGKLEEATEMKDIVNARRLTGYPRYYRIRIGEYRLGLELIEDQSLRVIVFCHRSDIYKKFP